jgi:hypothetical protein
MLLFYIITGHDIQDLNAAPTLYRPLSSLIPWAKNYNLGDVDAIARSIRRFGYNRTIAIWRESICSGQNRIKTTLSRGWLEN